MDFFEGQKTKEKERFFVIDLSARRNAFTTTTIDERKGRTNFDLSPKFPFFLSS